MASEVSFALCECTPLPLALADAAPLTLCISLQPQHDPSSQRHSFGGALCSLVLSPSPSSSLGDERLSLWHDIGELDAVGGSASANAVAGAHFQRCTFAVRPVVSRSLPMPGTNRLRCVGKEMADTVRVVLIAVRLNACGASVAETVRAALSELEATAHAREDSAARVLAVFGDDASVCRAAMGALTRALAPQCTRCVWDALYVSASTSDSPTTHSDSPASQAASPSSQTPPAASAAREGILCFDRRAFEPVFVARHRSSGAACVRVHCVRQPPRAHDVDFIGRPLSACVLTCERVPVYDAAHGQLPFDRMHADLTSGAGFFVLRNAIADAAKLDALRAALASVHAENARASGESSVGPRAWDLVERGDAFVDYVSRISSLLWPLMAQFFGASDAFVLSSLASNVLSPGGARHGTPHVDFPYSHMATRAWMSMPANLNLQTIFALDDFEEGNGTMVVPFSHRSRVPPLTSEDAHNGRATFAERAVSLSAPRGSVVVANCVIEHASGCNSGGAPRAALLMHFCQAFVSPIEKRRCVDDVVAREGELAGRLTTEERARLRQLIEGALW